MERSFDQFRRAIALLPLSSSIDRDLLETEPFVLGTDGILSVVYAPFDYVNADARLALVGVTPGWTQMHASFVEARSGIDQGRDTEQILRRVKRVAAFSGSLRTNLVRMLDGIGIADALGVDSSDLLLTEECESLLHSTSAIRYPTFKAGKNYAGSGPSIAKAPLLVPYLNLLAGELRAAKEAIVIPLGRAVETALRYLTNHDSIAERRCLFGFPHPSGANAHRASQYADNRFKLAATAQKWFDS